MSFIPGANVGPYRIVEQAERSGVTTSYTAYQPSLGRYVTVVVVPAIDRDDVALQRQYQRQLELVLSLRHPNILTVIDSGEHLGVPYVVTEMLEAEPLSDRLGAPWPLAEVVRVLRPIAAGLDYAHGLGVVHGDVRPSSVVLTPDGTPILAGFGLMTRPLAVPAVSGGDFGRNGPSPLEEIAQAQPADRRGLALIAYEMLTGRTTEVEAAEFEKPLLPAQIGSPLLAAPVERVLMRELAGGSAERYANASAFMDDLSTPVESTRPNGASHTPPVVTPPAPEPPPADPEASSNESRRRLITVALIFAALALVGALAILLRGGDATRPIAAPARTPGTENAVTGTAVGTAGTGGAASGSAATPAADSGPMGQPKAPSEASAAGQAGASTASTSGAPAAASSGGQASGTASAPSGQATAPASSSSSAAAASPGGASTANPSGATASGTPARSGPSITLLVPSPEVPTPVPTVTAAQPGATSGTVAAQPAATASGSGAVGSGAASSGAASTPAPTPGPATAVPPATGSTRLPATWRAVGDPSGRWQMDDQGRVAGRTETGASVLLFPEAVDDVGFSADVSTTSCQATLVFRAQDDENLLMAIYIPDGLPAPGTAGGGVWLYQRVEGLDLPIRAVRPSTVRPAGEPVRLKVITSGPQISIFLNDQPAMQALDTAPRSGKLGLMVYSTSGRLCEATFGNIER